MPRCGIAFGSAVESQQFGWHGHSGVALGLWYADERARRLLDEMRRGVQEFCAGEDGSM